MENKTRNRLFNRILHQLRKHFQENDLEKWFCNGTLLEKKKKKVPNYHTDNMEKIINKVEKIIDDNKMWIEEGKEAFRDVMTQI